MLCCFGVLINDDDDDKSIWNWRSIVQDGQKNRILNFFYNNLENRSLSAKVISKPRSVWGTQYKRREAIICPAQHAVVGRPFDHPWASEMNSDAINGVSTVTSGDDVTRDQVACNWLGPRDHMWLPVLGRDRHCTCVRGQIICRHWPGASWNTDDEFPWRLHGWSASSSSFRRLAAYRPFTCQQCIYACHISMPSQSRRDWR